MAEYPRPQDLYPVIGELTTTTTAHADNLAITRVSCETWNPDDIRVDGDSGWSAEESLAAVQGDLAEAEAALRVAVGRLEAAWSALGRLSAD